MAQRNGDRWTHEQKNREQRRAEGIDLQELLDAEKDEPLDYNRGAGGAPQVSDPENPEGPFVQHSRTSSFGDILDSQDSLKDWLLARAMEGVARKPELAAQVIAADGDKKVLRDLKEEAIDAGRGRFKADLGTAFHKMSEHWEQKPDFDPGEPYRSALERYEHIMRELGLVSQHFEVKLVNDEFRASGTADRIYELTKPLLAPNGRVLLPGTLVIGDIKTGNLEYAVAGYCVQTAIYAGGVLYDVATNRRLPTPPIDQEWGILMHVDIESGQVDFLWVDLEVGRFGARLAAEVKEWRRAWRRKEGYKTGVQYVTVAEGDHAPVEPEVVEPPVKSFRETAADARPEYDLDDLRAWTQKRLRNVREHDAAYQWLLIRWDKNLPGPKKADLVQLMAINEFLDAIEAEFEFGFDVGDPRPQLRPPMEES